MEPQAQARQDLEAVNSELQAKNKQYLAITNALQEAIITTDSDGNIAEVNPAVLKVFGYLPAELIGKPITIFMPQDQIEFHAEEMIQFKATGRPTSSMGRALEVDALRKDGSIVPIAISLMPVELNGKTCFVAVARDVTHRRNNEKHLSILLETLQTRVAALEAFQFSLIHDLNAPLRTIEGFSEILEEDHALYLDEKGKQCITKIRAGTYQMRHLIRDMLRLSRVTQTTELEKEVVNLSDIGNKIKVDLLERDADRNIEVVITPDMIVYANQEFMEIALNNLLDNAWKFTTKKKTAKIEFGSIKVDNETVYYVKDNGAGFDMAKADKLFKPFSRLHDKKDFEGNGIGLSVVKQVITLHSGRVWASGDVDQGATFYFTIGTKNGGTN